MDLTMAFSDITRRLNGEEKSKAIANLLARVFNRGYGLSEENPDFWTELDNATRLMETSDDKNILLRYGALVLKVLREWHATVVDKIEAEMASAVSFLPKLTALVDKTAVDTVAIETLCNTFDNKAAFIEGVCFDVRLAVTNMRPNSAPKLMALADDLVRRKEVGVVVDFARMLCRCINFLKLCTEQLQQVNRNFNSYKHSGMLFDLLDTATQYFNWYGKQRHEAQDSVHNHLWQMPLTMMTLDYSVDGAPVGEQFERLIKDIRHTAHRLPRQEFCKRIPEKPEYPAMICYTDTLPECYICLEPAKVGIAPCPNIQCGLSFAKKLKLCHYDCFREMMWAAQYDSEEHRLFTQPRSVDCTICGQDMSYYSYSIDLTVMQYLPLALKPARGRETEVAGFDGDIIGVAVFPATGATTPSATAAPAVSAKRTASVKSAASAAKRRKHGCSDGDDDNDEDYVFT